MDTENKKNEKDIDAEIPADLTARGGEADASEREVDAQIVGEAKQEKTKAQKFWSIFGIVVKWFFVSILLFIIIGNIVCLIKQRVKKELVPTFCGFALVSVISDSMYPTLVRYEDIFLLKHESSYKVGDIVTFINSDGAAVTHRIISIDAEGKYVTKGDYFYNSQDDEHLTNEDIIGRSVLIMKGAGKTLEFFQSAAGILVLVITGLILIELPYAIKAIKENSEKKRLQARLNELEAEKLDESAEIAADEVKHNADQSEKKTDGK